MQQSYKRTPMPKCDFNKVAKQKVGFGFALNGAVNNHNVRMYAPSNQPPNFYYNVDGSCQKLTVWRGLCGNGAMLGPFFFDGNVNGQSYLNFLNDKVIPLMTVLFQNQFYEN